MSLRFWPRVFSVFVMASLILGIFTLEGIRAGSLTAPISERREPEVNLALLEEIQTQGSANFMIFFLDKPDLGAASQLSWTDRGWYVMNALQHAAGRSQLGVRNYLDEQQVSYQSFWIDNIIVVERGDISLLDNLRTFPEIDLIRSEPEIFLIEPELADQSGPALLAVEPNIQHVNAPGVWDLGITGEGITLASIDTGVRFTHQALVNQYRGNSGDGAFNHNYNWWDPYESTTVPSDQHGHGSHVTGIMVGDDGGSNQIGMAPGAQWIACRGFNPSATTAGLLECAQFLAAPWDLTGANPDPARRPHLVNNSWGSCTSTYDPWYQGVVDNWHSAGIYPIFSNGNSSNCGYPSPPGLNTVGNPARYGNVTGVGSTGTNNGEYAPHSNWGPTDNPDTVNPSGYPMLKPQFLAPGVGIRSATWGSDTSYTFLSGTSMASPHAAGLIALVWQAAPCLTGEYGTTETLIEQTATPIPYNSGGSPPPGPGNVPNYAAGWGEINALAAVNLALTMCGDSASSIRGIVTESTANAPLGGASVAVRDGSYIRTATTLPDGSFHILALFPGTYSVSASKFGYLPQTEGEVAVAEGETVTVDFSLSLLGRLEADPTRLYAALRRGSSTTIPLDLANVGSTEVNWEIQVRAGIPSPVEVEVLVVRRDSDAADAMQSALAELGVTFGGVTESQFQALSIEQLLCYDAVMFTSTTGYEGSPSVSELKLMAYLDAGGSLYISDNDLGYYRNSSAFYTNYLQANYVLDNGGELLTGEDIMLGLDLDISPDPFPDGFTVEAEGARIFKYNGTDYAGGAAVARSGYRAIYTAFDFHNAGNEAQQVELLERILDYLVRGKVAWLSAGPISGAVPAFSSQEVEVTWDASQVETTGIYNAHLEVKNDSPYGTLAVPVEFVVQGEANLTLNLSLFPTPVVLGQPATLTVVVENTGEDRVYGIVITGEMPEYVAVLSSSPGCEIEGKGLTCDLGSIEAGASRSASLEVIFTVPGPFTIGLVAGIPAFDPVWSAIDVQVQGRLFLPLVKRH